MLEKSEIAEIERILDRVLPSNDNFKNTPLHTPQRKTKTARISVIGNNNIIVESNWLMLLTILSLLLYQVNS